MYDHILFIQSPRLLTVTFGSHSADTSMAAASPTSCMSSIANASMFKNEITQIGLESRYVAVGRPNAQPREAR
jgi:hypothetical protein